MIKMTEDEFNAACDEAGGYSRLKTFRSRWSTGGTFGNCWNDNLSSFGGSDPEPLKDHWEFLEKYFPNITFIQGRKIEALVERYSDSEGDYYGGRENFIVESLSYKHLMDELIAMGLLEII